MQTEAFPGSESEVKRCATPGNSGASCMSTIKERSFSSMEKHPMPSRTGNNFSRFGLQLAIFIAGLSHLRPGRPNL